MAAFWKVTGKTALAVAMLLVLNIVVSIPIAIVGVAIVSMRSGGELGSAADLTAQLQAMPWFSTLSFMATSACSLLVVWIMYAALERNRTWPLGWRQPHRARNGVLGLLLGAGLIAIGFLLVLALGGAKVVEAVMTPEVAYALALDAVLFLAVSVGEEAFCRGYVYGLVKRHGGVPLAVAVSSLVFAGLHASNPAVFANAFPMLNLALAGVMLAMLRELTGGLWAPIGLHLTWNFFQGDVFGMAVSGTVRPSILRLETLDPAVSGGAFGFEGSFLCTAILVLACLALLAGLARGRVQAA